MTLTRKEQEDRVAFGLSFLIHLILLLSMALYFHRNESDQVRLTILSSTPEDDELLEDHLSLQDIFDFSDTDTFLTPSEASQPDPFELDSLDPKHLPMVDERALTPPQEVPPSEWDFLDIPFPDIDASNPRAGVASEGLASIGGAIDRLTAEIVKSAAQRETLIVWLFDASLSLNAQRRQISERLDKILMELRFDADLHPIKHVVCSFGEELRVMLGEPSQDKDRILQAIADISLDESGVENTFKCVGSLCSRYKSTGRTRTMIMTFTDEVGDDQVLADRTTSVAIRNGVAVYVVGTPAPFGLAKTELRFVDPDDNFDQSERWVEIEQGPETLLKMTLNIHSLPIDSEPMDSGYGPYALSRLCASTGGVYFALHPNRLRGTTVERGQIQAMSTNIQHFFDMDVMRQYPPDRRADGLQRREVFANAAKKALVGACSLDHIDVARELKTIFDATNQGVFVAQLSDGQKVVASLLPKIESLYSILHEGEKAASQLKEPRWRASYFLAMGRVLAIKTRLDAYNSILGDAKTDLKAADKKTNRWVLEPSNDYALLNSALKNQSNSARTYLETVATDYPDTPWALMAQKELGVPLAYRWVEAYFEPPKTNPTGNASPSSRPEDDKKRMLTKPKPTRKLDKI